MAAVAFALGFDANVLKLLKLLKLPCCVTTKTTNKLKCDRKINNPKKLLAFFFRIFIFIY